MADYVDTYRVQITGQQDVQALGAAMDKTATAAEGVADAVDTSSQRVTRSLQTAKQLANTYDDQTKAANNVTKAQAALTFGVSAADTALATNSLTAQQHQNIVAGLTTKLINAQAAYAALTGTMVEMAESAAAADPALATLQQIISSISVTSQAAAASQQSFNEILGVGVQSRSYAEAASAVSAFGAQLDGLRGKYVPLDAAQQQTLGAIDEIAGALKVGALSYDEFEDAIDRTTSAFAKQVTAANNAKQAASAAVAAQGQGIANNFAGVSVAPTSADTEASIANFTAAAEAADQLRAKYVPLAAASQALDAGFREVTEALGAGILTTAEAQAAYQKLEATQEAAIAAQNGMGASLDTLRAKYDPLFATSKQYETALSDIATLESAGAISAAGAAKARDNASSILAASVAPTKAAKAALDEHTAASNSASLGLRTLTVQGSQFFSGLLTGQPIVMSAIQQGHQLIDVAQSSGQGFSIFSAAISKVASYLTPTVLLIGGLTVGVAAAGAGMIYLGVQAETNARQLISLQDTLQATRSDYVALAQQAQTVGKSLSIPGVSSTDAASAAAIIQSTRNYAASDQQLKVLLTDVADYAKVTGVDIPAAAKYFASAINDPAKAAQDAADKGFTAFSAGTLNLIKNMADAGDKAGAFATFLQALNPSIQGAIDNTTPLQKAIKGLDDVFKSADGSGKGLGATLGGAVTAAAEVAIKSITGLLQIARDLYNFSQTVVDKATAYAAGRGSTAPDANVGTPVLGTPVQMANGQYQQAVGLMQVMPTTAQGLGYTTQQISTSTEANIYAAIGDLTQKLIQADGDLTAALGRYGGASTPQGVAAYNAKIAAADPSTLDPAIARLIENANVNFGASGVTGGPEYSIPTSTLQKIAVVESGGQQYATAAQLARQQAYSLPSGPIDTSNNAIVVGSAGVTNRTNLTDANDYANAHPSIPMQYTANQNAQSTLQLGIDAAQANNDIDTVTRLKSVLNDLKGTQTDLLTAQEKLSRGITDGLPPLNAEEGAQRTIAEVVNQATIAARAQNGGTIDAISLSTAIAAKQSELASAFADVVRQTDLQTASQLRINAAFDNGAASVIQATNQEKALELAKKDYLPTDEARAAAVAQYTASLNASSAAQADFNTLQKSFQQNNDLQVLSLESQSLGENADQRNKEIALLQEKQALIKSGADLSSAASVQDLANVARISDATAALKLQTDSLGELSNFAQSTFDTIGQSITQAFATGGAAAINFGSIAQAALASVLQEVLKLAVLNPILNTLFGTNNVTLSSVGGVIGSLLGNSSGGSSSGGIGSLLGLGGSSSSSGIFGDNSTQGGGGSSSNSGSTGLLGSGTGILGSNISGSDLLGGVSAIAAVGGLLSGKTSASSISPTQALSLATYAYKGISYIAPQTTASITNAAYDTFTDAANTAGNALGLTTSVASGALAGGVSTAAATAGQTVSIAAADSFATATGSAATAASSLASALPLLGVAVGIITDLVTGNLRGAAFVATGAAAGATIGSFVGPVGTVIGAAIGAVVGGIVDTFFPQHPKNPYSNTEVDVTDGQLTRGPSVSQLIDTSGTDAAVDEFNTQFNAFLSSLNLTITNVNQVVGNIGQNITGLTQLTSPDQVIGNLRFGSSDNTTNFGVAAGGALQGQQFGTIDQFTAYLQTIADFADRMTGIGIQLANVGPQLTNISVGGVRNPNADGSNNDLYIALNHDLQSQVFANETALDAEIDKVNQFVNGTIPSLVNPVLAVVAGPVQTGVNKIVQQYAAAEAQAQAYGLSIDSLAQGMNEAITEYVAPALKSLNNETASITARGYAATGDQEDADLINYDVSIADEQSKYSADLLDVHGAAFAGTQEYLDDINQLETVEGEERAAIVKKYADQATQAATAAAQSIAQAYASAQSSVQQVVAGIQSYADGLDTSSASPLSPTAQYQLASNRFHSTAAAAASGDITAAGNLTNYADSFLSASQAIYGTGAQYSADFGTVVDALSAATANPDALTNSALIAATQQQTEKLSDAIAEVRDQLIALRTQLGATPPARVTA